MFLHLLFASLRIARNTWITGSSSVVPVAGGTGIWNLPSRPSLVFDLPDLPESSLPAGGGTPQSVGTNGGGSAGGTGAKGEGNGGGNGGNGGNGGENNADKGSGNGGGGNKDDSDGGDDPSQTKTSTTASSGVAHRPLSLVRPAQLQPATVDSHAPLFLPPSRKAYKG